MIKDYIKFYKYDADYQAAKPNLPVPHAVYCWETNITDISEPLWNEKQYLAFQAVDGPATVIITNNGGAAPQLEFSFDQVEWTDWTAAGYAEIPLEENQKVYLRGINEQMGYTTSKYSAFSGTGKYNVSGSISSLLNGDDIFGNLTLTKGSCFHYLFYNNTSIINADKLLLPYDVLYSFCYNKMFSNCTYLTSTPDLPATTLANYCYTSMFSGCTSLVSTPNLPATTLADYCYNGMFYGCTSLVTAPELPATTLANYCYSDMFYGCKALTYYPSLPALELTMSCYQNMFRDTGSFTGKYILPALTLNTGSYNNMFWGSNISSVEIHATKINSGSANYAFMAAPKLLEMTMPNCTSFEQQTNFMGVSNNSAGVFKCSRALKEIPRGNAGIPTNWTIEYLD